MYNVALSSNEITNNHTRDNARYTTTNATVIIDVNNYDICNNYNYG